jgi:hypothetical protein
MTLPQDCRHVMPSGEHCKSPAMRGTCFCYFHGRPQRPARASRPAETPIDVALVFEEETALQAMNEIVQALAANRISNRRAALLLYGVQMAAARKVDFSMPFDLEDTPGFEDSLEAGPGAVQVQIREASHDLRSRRDSRSRS